MHVRDKRTATQVLMFYRLGKEVRKTWQPPPPSPLYARGFNAKGDDGVLLGKH